MSGRAGESPFIAPSRRVSAVMTEVLAALVPGTVALVWCFGYGVVVQIGLAVSTALAMEWAVLAARGRRPLPVLTDGSAVVTAVLLAVSIPALAPWWLIVIGTGAAIVLGKQLFGGLGYNPFNPAMVGYVVLLIAFPLEMSAWPAAGPHALPGLGEAWGIITGSPAIDGYTGATTLDSMRTAVHGGGIAEPGPGWSGAGAWQWPALAWLAGGLWLVARRVADWRIPLSLLLGLLLLATLGHLFAPEHLASPLVHAFAGATMLGAFFIATDPVSAAATPVGRWWYGLGIGVLTWVIRSVGGYPDGLAFAVLLMNLAAPTIDYYTTPKPFGAGR